jgi:hypothetical protein
MTRGIAGYGRYDSDLDHVGCPWARTSETPCVARDGSLAVTSEPRPQCVGCGNYTPFLFRDLADDWPGAGVPVPADPATAADLFRDLVRAATAPLAKGGTGDRPEPAGPPDPEA